MKILVIGFVVLFGWSALSTHIYVCKIKGLCNESENTQIDTLSQKNVIVDTAAKPLALKQVVIPENLLIHFAFDKSEFNPETSTDQYINESILYLDRNSQAMVRITGFTDAVGSDEYNQTLGYRRAQSVQHYFESKGLLSNKITIESRGEKEPADNNNTTAGRANNRRAEITIKN